MSKHFLNFPVVYNLGTKWIGYIPRPLAYAFSQSIACASYVFYKSAVNSVKQNLMRALPATSAKQISRLTLRLFRNYSKYLVDYGRFMGLGKYDVLQKIIHFEGRENLDAVLKINKGVILLTAHLGNWELGGIFFGNYGLKTNVVTIQDNNAEIDYARRWYREKHNVNTITIGNSPFSTVEMVNALNNNEMVAMLIDRYYEGLDYITEDFFKKPMRFPKGPFVLSRLTGAPILVAFVVREDKGYKGIIEKPILVTDGKEEHEMLNQVVKILERYIMIYPDQWYNFIKI